MSGRTSWIGALCALALLAALPSQAGAVTHEPNDSYLTATGPLTAGTTYSGAYETSNDYDYFYFYLPQLTQLQFRTTNTSGGSSYLCSHIERQHLDRVEWIDDTYLNVDPGETKSGAVTLERGKYYYVLDCPGTVGKTYTFSINPPGVTSTYEPFALACAAAHPPVAEAAAAVGLARTKFKASKARLEQARNWRPKRKQRLRRRIAQLRIGLEGAKANYTAAAANEAAACSVPQ